MRHALRGADATEVLPRSLSDTMVLFDWNGTIVLDIDRARASINGVLHRRALPVLDAAQFTARFRLPMPEMFAELGVSTGELDAAEAEWNEGMVQSTTNLRGGSQECLDALSEAGAWLGVVSAAAQEAVRFDQLTLDVARPWQSVEAPVVDKLEVLRRRRPQRDRAFYVGDTPYDMRCAVTAGYTAIGATGGYASTAALAEAGAQHFVGSLVDLLEIVRPVH